MIEMLPGYFTALRSILVEEGVIEDILFFIKEVNPDPVKLFER